MDIFVLHTGNYAEKSNAFENKKSNNLSISQHMNMKLRVVVWSICATAVLLPGGNDAKVLMTGNFMGKYYIKCFSFFIPPIHQPSKILNRLSKTMHSTVETSRFAPPTLTLKPDFSWFMEVFCIL